MQERGGDERRVGTVPLRRERRLERVLRDRDRLAEVGAGAALAERAEDLVDRSAVQDRERAAQPVAVGVAALQVALARLRVRRAAVQDAQVVDGEQVARLELEADLVARRRERAAERAVRVVPLARERRRRRRRARVEVHGLELAADVERQHRPLGLELGRVVAVAEAERVPREQLEHVAVEVGRDAERVDERVLAAACARGETVEQLQRRRRVAVRVVAVRAEAETGVGEVRRLDDRADVEEPPVVRLADVPEQLGDARDRPRLGRTAEQDREAEPVERREPASQRLAAGGDVVEALGRQSAGELSPPQLSSSRRHELLRSQPLEREAADVAVREADDERPVDPLDVGELEVVGDRDAVEEPLAARVAALDARTVVPQPDGVEGGDLHR